MPWKLFDPDKPFFIQGMTGKEGARMARWLLASGAQIRAGITPGKAGEQVEGCPIFDSVQAAKDFFSEVEVSTVVVPAPRVLAAVEEALAAGIKYIHVLAENVPVHDTLRMRQAAERAGAVILGPSSVGYLQFPAFRLGYLGGENPWSNILVGDTAIISTSGGMANELMMACASASIGIRLVLSVGGDRFPLFSLEKALTFCEEEPQVTRVMLFVEPGRPLLSRLTEGSIAFSKLKIIFLAGDILDALPRGRAYGHTGTLLGEAEGSIHEMRDGLRGQGYLCVSDIEACIQGCK